MSQAWHRLRIAVPADAVEEFSAFCFEIGSCGLESTESILTVYFDADLNIDRLRRELDAHSSEGEFSAGEWDRQEERDWTREWRQFYQPVRVAGRYVVHPPWLPIELREGELPIVIDPGMAFGTGGHESTQLCLEALAHLDRRPETCLDVGTGSGVLAIAALLEGVRSLSAIDIDPKAVENARANICFNRLHAGDEATAQWAGSYQVFEGSVEAVRDCKFDLILANLESHIIYPILEPLGALMSDAATIVFSGLLAREEAHFESEIRAAGFIPRKRHRLNDWICCSARLASADKTGVRSGGI